MSSLPLVIGHRGASADAPENTIAAFQMAIDAGADGVEFDVQLAKDGVPVVIHDTDLRRTGQVSESVAGLTSKQLAKIDVGSWFNAAFPDKAQAGFAKERVPTLGRILDLLKGASGPIYIELKCDESNYRQLVAALCARLRDSPMLPRAIVKSFKLAVIPEVRHLLPGVQTAALFEQSIMTILRSRKYMIAMAREFGAHQISLDKSLVTRSLVELAAAARMPVTVWTVDRIKKLSPAVLKQLSAIITNDPARLKADLTR